jgi:hypothetical protein
MVVKQLERFYYIGDDTMEIRKGTQITTKQRVFGGTFNYMVIQEGNRSEYRLLNLRSHYIMDTFKSDNPNDVVDYIENKLKSDIVAIHN